MDQSLFRIKNISKIIVFGLKMVLVGIFLHEHQANNDRMWPIGEVIRRCSLERKIPLTYSMTGITLEAMVRCCPDVVAGMRWDFANHLTGWDGNKPELVISTYNNIPLVLPDLSLDNWGTFFEEFVREQVEKSKRVAEQCFHRTPRGIFPPEMIFAPASAHGLEKVGMHYGLIGGEYFGDDHFAKGQVYFLGDNYNLGLKLLVRNNELNLYDPSKHNSYQIKEEIKAYAYRHGIERVVIGCDLGHFTGLYASEGRVGLSLHDGIARLCNLADEIYHDSDLHLINCAAIADSYWYPLNLYEKYRQKGIADSHHFISTWMNAQGDLSSLLPEKVKQAVGFVSYYADRIRRGDRHHLQEEKERWFWQSGAENLMRW